MRKTPSLLSIADCSLASIVRRRRCVFGTVVSLPKNNVLVLYLTGEKRFPVVLIDDMFWVRVGQIERQDLSLMIASAPAEAAKTVIAATRLLPRAGSDRRPQRDFGCML